MNCYNVYENGVLEFMKYRVYDIVENSYVTDEYDFVITPSGKLCLNLFGGDKCPIPGEPVSRPCCIAEFSSGEVDKNGVEIFEGDIVSMPAHPRGRLNSVVYFERGKFAVNGSNSVFKDLKSRAYEVVGTVHNSKD